MMNETRTNKRMSLVLAVGQAVLLDANKKKRRKWKHDHRVRGRRYGCRTRERQRRSIDEVREMLGDGYFKRSLRMKYQSFRTLVQKLSPEMMRNIPRNHDSSRHIPNGPIGMDVRIGVALRYFAGGDPIDIMGLFGIGHADVFFSVWNVVDAINNIAEFELRYPDSHEKQREIAATFRVHSGADFDCCAGCIDGILVWIQRPPQAECDAIGCGAAKFFCGRKHKFGLNCQAVADARGTILDVSVVFPGSTSDCLSFEGSKIYSRLEDGLLAPGLCLFGDNAYINTP
jgi:DDE superfamily endonuclease